MTPESLEVVALAYETVGDMARWPELLQRAQSLVGADATIQLTIEATPHLLRRAEVLERTHVLGLDPAVAALYAELTPSSPIALPVTRLAPGDLTPVHALMPRSMFARSDFFDAWVRPNRMHDALIGPITPIASTMTVLNFLRADDRAGRRYEEEDPVDRAFLEHVGRAFGLNTRLARAGIQTDRLASDMLDAVATSLLAFDASGRVLWMNAAAERMLAAGDGLRLDRDRRLVAMRATDAKTLARLVFETVAGRGAAASVERPSRRLALCLTSAPLSRGRRDGARAVVGERAEPVGVLAIHAPDDAFTTVEAEALQARLRALFGLTPAESAVAVQLAHRNGITAAADMLGVTHATVHTHARRIFQKMSLNGQGALMQQVQALRVLDADGASGDGERN